MHIDAMNAQQGVFGGSGPATDQFPRDRQFDLQHVKLDLRLDEHRREFHGTAELTLAPINDGLEEVRLDAVDLKVGAVRMGKKPLLFHVHDGALLVTLARACKAGETVVLSIDYEAKNPKKGLYFIQPDRGHPRKPYQIWSQGEMEDNRYWFPCYDYPNDKCTSEAILTVSDRFTAISNGRLESVKHDRAKRLKTFHWKHDVPHPTYLISVAVGEFDSVKEKFGKIPVEYYVQKGLKNRIEPTFGRTVDILKFFSEKIGVHYPYEKYVQVAVADFVWGGMENTSMTIVTDRALVPQKHLPDTDSDGLVAHEIAHQWWGDLVTTKTWQHTWLNEGFASYFDPLYQEHAKGKDEFWVHMRSAANGYFAETGAYKRPIVTNRYPHPEDMFDRHTYCKGAWVLHMLRWYLGNDLFWKGIRHYIQGHARRNVETTDLKVALEEATGRNLELFFQQWLYRAGHPEFEVRSEWDSRLKVLRVHVKQTQKTDDLHPTFRMPVEILVDDGKTQETHRVQVDRAEEIFTFPMETPPKMVVFDPDHWILKKLKFSRSTGDLLYQLKHGKSCATRVEAAEALGKGLRDPEAVAGLEECLRGDPFYAVRQEAARALGELKGEEALKALLRGLSDRDPKVRRVVAEQLGKFKPEESGAALRRAARSDRSDFVRAAAMEAIGKSKGKDAFPRLAAGTRLESWNDILRAAALRGMGELGDVQGVPVCLKFAQYGNALSTRTAAIASLIKLAKKLPAKREEIRDALVGLEHDPEYFVRRALMDAFGEFPDDKVRAALGRALETDLFFNVRRSARLALEKLDKGQDAGARVDALQAQVLELRERCQSLTAALATLQARQNGGAKSKVHARR